MALFRFTPTKKEESFLRRYVREGNATSLAEAIRHAILWYYWEINHEDWCPYKKGDKKFLQRTEKAWKDYKKGKFISKSKKEFVKELDKW